MWKKYPQGVDSMLKDLKKQMEEQLKLAQDDLEKRVKDILPSFEVKAMVNMDFTSILVNITKKDKIIQSVNFSRTIKDNAVQKDLSAISYQQNIDNSISLAIIPTTLSVDLINFMFSLIDSFVQDYTAENK